MITNDYLVRLIEKLSAAFFNLVAGKVSTPEETVASDIERMLAESLNANPLFLFSHLDAVLEECDPRLGFQLTRLLKLHGEAVDDSKADKSFTYAAKFAQIALGAPQHREETRNLLRALHQSTTLPPEILDTMMEVEVTEGAIAFAEDLLFAGLEIAPTDARVDRGIRFYEALEELDTSALNRGNFSKEEIEEGREQLLTYGAKS